MKTFITLLGTVVCTVLIYYLLFNEYDTLFYVNVISTCVIEIILLSGIPLFSEKKLLTFKNAASWTIISVFALLFFLWTTFYTLALANGENMNTLYIGQLIIVLLFIVLFGMTEIGGSVMQKHEEELHTTIKVKRMTLLSVNAYWLDMKELLANEGEWGNDMLRQVRNVLDKLSSIPAQKIERNEDVIDEVNGKLKELQALCEQLSDADSKEKRREAIERKIVSVKNYVVSIKTAL